MDDFNGEFADDREPQNAEKEIDKKISKLKIKIFLNKIKHFPALVLSFLKHNILGLFKLWGTIIFILIIYLLSITGGLSAVYYKLSIELENNKIESIKTIIELKQEQLKHSEKMVTCYKKQFWRIADSKEVKIGFCK